MDRNVGIDFFKGFLVVQMIFAHSLQFFVNLHESNFAARASDYINLTTFSGFVFAFGYVSYFAYLKRGFSVAVKKLILNIFKLMLAFYISSFAFIIFIENAFFRMDTVWDILLVRRLAGWSEFLFSFVCLMALCLILFPLLKRLNNVSAGILIAVSLLATFIPYRDINPILGSFIGGTNFAYFSVVQYFGFFVIGIMFASKKIVFDKWALLSAIIASSVFFVYFNFYGLPSRFPVSIFWILGPTIFLYIYYLVASKFPVNLMTEWLASIGSMSLFYLVLSNILIFALRSSRFYRLGLPTALVVFVVVLVTCYYLAGLMVVKRKKA